MFRQEDQLRKIWPGVVTPRTFLIEPGIGSNDGWPDASSVVDGALVFAELKKGELLRDGVLSFRVRKSQRDVIPALLEGGALGVVAVAQIGSAVVHVFDPLLPGVMRGKVAIGELGRVATLKKHEALNLPAGFPIIYRCGTVAGNDVEWWVYGANALKALDKLSLGNCA